jgi:hypothetical protein
MAKIINWNPPKIENSEAVLYNTSDYAPRVHEGETTKSGTTIRARPYMQTAIDETDSEQIFLENFNPDTCNVNQAFSDLIGYLHDETKANILDERWNWPRTTKRVSGQIVSSPRNIYDQGNLYENQKAEVDGVEI